MKITKLETIHLTDFPHMLFVAVHTDEGLVGYSDTFYMPDALRGYIHGFAAPPVSYTHLDVYKRQTQFSSA